MLTRLRSLEQLMPFATAGELAAQKGRPPIAISSGATALGALQVMRRENVGFLPIFAITLLKTAAVAVAIGVFYVTGIC